MVELKIYGKTERLQEMQKDRKIISKGKENRSIKE